MGEQAETEMLSFVPSDDNRKFTELYSVQRLKNSSVPKDVQVCISTIQRMYSILKDEELDVIGELISNMYGAIEVNKLIKDGLSKKEALNIFMSRVMGSIDT